MGWTAILFSRSYPNSAPLNGVISVLSWVWSGFSPANYHFPTSQAGRGLQACKFSPVRTEKLQPLRAPWDTSTISRVNSSRASPSQIQFTLQLLTTTSPYADHSSEVRGVECWVETVCVCVCVCVLSAWMCGWGSVYAWLWENEREAGMTLALRCLYARFSRKALRSLFTAGKRETIVRHIQQRGRLRWTFTLWIKQGISTV